MLSGDTHTARHLSYYAQLRAALSILNCHGIGIFNGVNFAVDDLGKPFHIGKRKPADKGLGTHTATWEALREWAGQREAGVFLKAVRFRDVSLLDCVNAVWPSAQEAPPVIEIINSWGVDLKRSAEDHESRNISSYCVHAFNTACSSLPSRLELVQSIWRGLEPDGRGGFPDLDRHLLRKFLGLMRKEQSKINFQTTPWQTVFRRLPPQVKAFANIEFLARDPTDFPVLANAESPRPGDVHAMVSRALLLLRLAVSVVRSAFLDAQFDLEGDDLQPWFDTVGIDRGFWSADHPPEEFEELWDEVSYVVADVETRNFTDIVDQRRFSDSLRNQLTILSQAERACIWGIGA